MTKAMGLSAWSHRADARSPPGEERCDSLPIWSCSVWGLPCDPVYTRPGALLPHRFTLTFSCCQPSRRSVFCCTGRPDALKHPSRTLSGTLPCGVRTFLPPPTPFGPEGSDRPTVCIFESNRLPSPPYLSPKVRDRKGLGITYSHLLTSARKHASDRPFCNGTE
jgi:hypothetical protein